MTTLDPENLGIDTPVGTWMIGTTTSINVKAKTDTRGGMTDPLAVILGVSVQAAVITREIDTNPLDIGTTVDAGTKQLVSTGIEDLGTIVFLGE